MEYLSARTARTADDFRRCADLSIAEYIYRPAKSNQMEIQGSRQGQTQAIEKTRQDQKDFEEGMKSPFKEFKAENKLIVP